MVDIKNDRAKKINTIPVLYGMKGTAYWVVLFTIIHYVTSIIFLNILGAVSIIGFSIGFLLLGIANYKIMSEKTADSAIKALPFFHISMLIYAVSIIIEYFV